MAGVLDSSRFRTFIAAATGVAAAKVEAMMIGEHGETMVPLLSRATIDDMPLKTWARQEEINRLVEKTRDAGSYILAHSGVPANIAPAYAVADMTEDFLKDRRRLISSSVWAAGAYDLKDIFIGLPSRIGAAGAFPAVLPIDDEEYAGLHLSAAAVRTATGQLPKTNSYEL